MSNIQSIIKITIPPQDIPRKEIIDKIEMEVVEEVADLETEVVEGEVVEVMEEMVVIE